LGSTRSSKAGLDLVSARMLTPFQAQRGSGVANPFAMMDCMMTQMMQSFGGGLFGGGLCGAGGPFGQMSQLMQGAGGGPRGSFTCQTMSFSSSVGADGRLHREHFASSTVADSRRGARETKQIYSNTSTGVEKRSLERRISDQGRKVVQERSRDEERCTDTLRGLEADQVTAFDDRWQREAAPHLPSHNVRTCFMLGDGVGGSGNVEDEEQQVVTSASGASARVCSSGRGHRGTSIGTSAGTGGVELRALPAPPPDRTLAGGARRGPASSGSPSASAGSFGASAPEPRRASRWRVNPY